jgi:hypothetical protein
LAEAESSGLTFKLPIKSLIVLSPTTLDVPKSLTKKLTILSSGFSIIVVPTA